MVIRSPLGRAQRSGTLMISGSVGRRVCFTPEEIPPMTSVSTVHDVLPARRRSRTRAGKWRQRSNPALRLNWLTMGGQLESRLLLANPSANIDQWADLAPAGWQNGNLGPSNSLYGEGQFVPFRLRMDNLIAGH